MKCPECSASISPVDTFCPKCKAFLKGQVFPEKEEPKKEPEKVGEPEEQEQPQPDEPVKDEEQSSEKTEAAAIIATCPGCRQKLKVPAGAQGSKIACPICRTVFEPAP